MSRCKVPRHAEQKRRMKTAKHHFDFVDHTELQLSRLIATCLWHSFLNDVARVGGRRTGARSRHASCASVGCRRGTGLGAHHNVDSDFDEELPDRTPADEFIAHLKDLLLERSLPAMSDCCIATWWAAKAGIGEATEFSKRPGLPSGHHQRHVVAAVACGR